MTKEYDPGKGSEGIYPSLEDKVGASADLGTIKGTQQERTAQTILAEPPNHQCCYRYHPSSEGNLTNVLHYPKRDDYGCHSTCSESM